MKVLASLFAVLAALAVSAVAHAQTVAVTGGQIRGTMLEKGGAVFKGIPYAAPPVSELRWRKPSPVKPWTGVRDATAFGSICPQAGRQLIPNAAELSSEDCLFLNIWTPEWPSTSPKPVMVWITGGGNFAGASSYDFMDGEKLSRRGVVLVSVNYRVGAFGFFSHPALTRESPNRASGNQGLLDQIAALKWVRDNIAQFGGDPGNVTLFGASAGSLDASVLMTSPLSIGLFHRVIGESNAVVRHLDDPMTLAEAERRGEAMAGRWRLPTDASLADMRAVSAADILKADPDYLSAGNFPYLGVAIDGYVVPKHPAVVFAAGGQHRVALMLGSNARERRPGTEVPTELAKTIAEAYGPLASRAQALYAGTRDPIHGSPAEQWATDTSFRCPAVAELMRHAAAGHASFHFEFARVPAGREAQGATHGSEVPYIFGTLDKESIFLAGARLNEVDARFSDVMQRYWTNFAKTGDPNGAGLPVWPRFDPVRRSYTQFTDAGPVAKEGLRREYCDLFIDNVKRQMGQ